MGIDTAAEEGELEMVWEEGTLGSEGMGSGHGGSGPTSGPASGPASGGRAPGSGPFSRPGSWDDYDRETQQDIGVSNGQDMSRRTQQLQGTFGAVGNMGDTRGNVGVNMRIGGDTGATGFHSDGPSGRGSKDDNSVAAGTG